jgi:hypothetical protein
MPKNQHSLHLSERTDQLIDQLAERGSMTRSQLIDRAVTILAVLLENQADPTFYVNSIKKEFNGG